MICFDLWSYFCFFGGICFIFCRVLKQIQAWFGTVFQWLSRWLILFELKKPAVEFFDMHVSTFQLGAL